MADKTLYRIYTEDINRETITDLVASKFDSYTFVSGRGVWQSNGEDCIIVEIIGEQWDFPDVRGIAAKIRDYNKQDSVLITRMPVESELV